MEIDHEYIDAAVAHGLGTDRGDRQQTNRAARQLLLLRDRLYALPDRGEAILSQLISHPNANVSKWAAGHLLPINETAAIAKLEQIMLEEKGIVGFDAEMVLRQWRSRH